MRMEANNNGCYRKKKLLPGMAVYRESDMWEPLHYKLMEKHKKDILEETEE